MTSRTRRPEKSSNVGVCIVMPAQIRFRLAISMAQEHFDFIYGIFGKDLLSIKPVKLRRREARRSQACGKGTSWFNLQNEFKWLDKRKCCAFGILNSQHPRNIFQEDQDEENYNAARATILESRGSAVNRRAMTPLTGRT